MVLELENASLHDLDETDALSATKALLHTGEVEIIWFLILSSILFLKTFLSGFFALQNSLRFCNY